MNQTCATCNWWWKIGESPHGGCVKLTGLSQIGGSKAPVVFGGSKPLGTLPTFGCNQWEEDRREK